MSPGINFSFSEEIERKQETWKDERALRHMDRLGPSEKPRVEPGVVSLEESGPSSFTKCSRDVERGLGLSCETPRGSSTCAKERARQDFT